MKSFLLLTLVSLLPVLLSAVLYLAERKTSFGMRKPALQQLIYGVLFGFLAVLGTEWGIPMNGAQMNCRDGAVLTAGLMFGAPAGLIAGFIGGVERWVAVAWGVGTFTRTACTVSTMIAGVYSAILRKFMFEDRKPGWLLSLAVGVVMEVFHLTMVFLTNMATPTEAMAAVRACTFPLIIANSVSVMLSSMVLSVLAKESIRIRQEQVRISQTVQKWLLVTVALAFAVTTAFVFALQNKLATTQTDSLLGLALQEVSDDIRDASDKHLLEVSREIAGEIGTRDINELAEKWGVSEIDIIDRFGVIEESTEKQFKGYDMGSQEQSEEFLCLLGDTQEYVQDYGPIGFDPSISRKYAGIKTGSGFVQVAYDAEDFQKDIAEQVVGITKNRHVGKTGFILILDKTLNVVSAPPELRLESLAEQAELIGTPEEDVTFPMGVNGETCYCRYRMTEGYTILSVLPQTEAMELRNTALYVNAFMEILVFAALFALLYFLIKCVVVDQLQKINGSLARIAGGNLNEVVNVRSNVEFASLSDDINSTVETMKHYISEASARIDKELDFAKAIQASALPSKFPAFPKRNDFDIFALMDPAKEVGGDFYDFYLTEDGRFHFLIADVSGKGIPAAMFMMRAKTELKTLTESELPINEVFTRGNDALCEGNDADMFVTAWQADVDLSNGLVRFANAGHNPPAVRHGNGKFKFLRSPAGFVLAGMEGIRYKPQELALEPGDVIFLYTDGVTEAQNWQKELYGEERLLRALNNVDFADMKSLCQCIKIDVDSFAGHAEQFDDITMVAFRYNG